MKRRQEEAERNWDSFASKIMNGGEISTRLAADCVGAGKSLNQSATEVRGKIFLDFTSVEIII